MSKFYYVNTGHRIGLDRFRRASAIIEHMQDEDIMLLTNDFRIAGLAKQYHFKKGAGIDVIRNIPNMAIRGDQMIFDSAEHSDIIMSDMQEFFSKMHRFVDQTDGDEADVTYANKDSVSVATIFEEKVEKDGSTMLFFGDDDYEKDLLALAKKSDLKEVDCLLGYYFFLESDDELRPYFRSIIEDDEYVSAIQKASLVITSSYQTALEASVSGSAVLYMQRVDYTPQYSEILKSMGIKVLPMQTIKQSDIESWKAEVKPIGIKNQAKEIAKEILDYFNR